MATARKSSLQTPKPKATSFHPAPEHQDPGPLPGELAPFNNRNDMTPNSHKRLIPPQILSIRHTYSLAGPSSRNVRRSRVNLLPPLSPSSENAPRIPNSREIRSPLRPEPPNFTGSSPGQTPRGRGPPHRALIPLQPPIPGPVSRNPHAPSPAAHLSRVRTLPPARSSSLAPSPMPAGPGLEGFGSPTPGRPWRF